MKELALLHDKHMNRPTLDDSSEEEHAIEITTQEITQVNEFSWCLKVSHQQMFLFKIQSMRFGILPEHFRIFLVVVKMAVHFRCFIGASELWQPCSLVVATAPSRRSGCWGTWSRRWRKACRICLSVSDTLSPATWNVRRCLLSGFSTHLWLRYLLIYSHVILLSRYEEPRGEVKTFFRLWSINGRGWWFSSIWKGFNNTLVFLIICFTVIVIFILIYTLYILEVFYHLLHLLTIMKPRFSH